MFFLLRAGAVIAFIYAHSPVHDEPGRLPDGFADGNAWTRHLATDALAGLIDETHYDNWTALPQHARDRLRMEIARQLADAAATHRMP